MTILGVHVTGPQSAFAWTDSESVWHDGKDSAGFCNKLAVNAHAALVCLGTGWAALMSDAIREAMRAASLDEAVREMPKFLRHHAERIALHPKSDAASYGRQAVILAGHSHENGRMLAFELAAMTCFEPAMQTRVCKPYVPSFDSFDPDRGIGGLARVVKEQTDILRDYAPGVTGGTLVVARISPGGVACGPRLDLTSHTDLDGAPSPARGAASVHKFASERRGIVPDANAQAVQEGSAWTARSIFHRHAA